MTDGRPTTKFVAARLWERKGPRDTFLSGVWGGARVLIVPNPDRADESDATHLLVLGENPAAVRKAREARNG